MFGSSCFSLVLAEGVWAQGGVKGINVGVSVSLWDLWLDGWSLSGQGSRDDLSWESCGPLVVFPRVDEIMKATQIKHAETLTHKQGHASSHISVKPQRGWIDR